MNHSYCCLPLRAAHFKTVTISVFIDILSFRTIMGFSHTYLQRNVLVIFVFLSIMTLSNIYMLPSSRLLQEYNRRPTIFQCLLNHHYLIISVYHHLFYYLAPFISVSKSFSVTSSTQQFLFTIRSTTTSFHSI